ncbi:hypothetical protein SAMN02927923_01658 [Microvirga guangxiensis]|uniref:Uncharacterized protein n=1 Tax=Microvirga guangxiensis TaxID=549386 RepID=A0A1G5GW64_9HYPH|nr:hypothetical protein SAMN02927923_01658 [Microvirga guangxiensis]
MPVLDAKALEVDPKGVAFLKSVLRPHSDAGFSQPHEVAQLKGSARKANMQLRLARHLKQLLPHLA